MAVRVLAFTTVLSAFIAGIACGGDDDASDSSKPAIEPTSTAEEGVGSEEGFQSFTSSGLGYSISYPESWTAQEAEERALIRADLFLAPEPEDDFTTNVNILCEPVPSGTSTEDYFDANLTTYETQGVEVEVVDDAIEFAGESGVLVHWSQAAGLELSQVIATVDDCGWVLTLTTAPGLRDEYEDLFLTMVESFEPN